MTLFAVHSLCKKFGHRQVVNNFSMHVEAGEIVGLLGSNGAGKSTTFRMVVGLLRADAGRIEFEGKDITRLPMYARARLGISYLAQEPTYFAQLTVQDNLQIILEQHYPASEHAERLENLLGEMGLHDFRNTLASKLSGGYKRRLEVTRALVVAPKLMFFDEPFPGVDPRSRHDIGDTIRDLRKRGVSVLITDHNEREIFNLVDRLYVMDAGSNIAAGTPEEIKNDRAVRRVYLGDDYHDDHAGERVDGPVVAAASSPAADAGSAQPRRTSTVDAPAVQIDAPNTPALGSPVLPVAAPPGAGDRSARPTEDAP
jgi:lipopolysaccharide export system ATP-binding protein